MTDRRIIVRLSGGLGNQMFQYAAARALAKRIEGELVLDSWSGFARDHVYKRFFELSAFPVKARLARPMERLPFWTKQILRRLKLEALGRTANGTTPIQGCRLSEPAMRFFSELVDLPIHPPVWMTGYWQSPKYFAGAEPEIVAELTPPTPSQNQFLSLGERLRSETSVAVGVRLYEESHNPGDHSNDGKLKTAEQVNHAISELASQLPNARFYIFCTHHAKELKVLDFPMEPEIITPDKGYDGTLENLWLLTQCRHHVITNSSFYWWGAWLAEQSNPAQNTMIFAADNFINQDGLPDHWKCF